MECEPGDRRGEGQRKRKILKWAVEKCILYGSYTRRDYTEDSDIEMMILVDLRNEALDSYLDPLSERGFRYNVEHDIWIMPIVKNKGHFKHTA